MPGLAVTLASCSSGGGRQLPLVITQYEHPKYIEVRNPEVAWLFAVEELAEYVDWGAKSSWDAGKRSEHKSDKGLETTIQRCESEDEA